MINLLPLRALGAAVALSALPGSAAADVRLHALFSDGMVLQRGATVTVWGWAEPGEEVSVQGGWADASARPVSAKADGSGRWQVTVETPGDAGVTTLAVKGAKNSIVVKDVALGEVWLCSGQSNMEWELSKTFAGAERKGLLDEAGPKPDRPDIRYFRVPRRAELEPLDDVEAAWLPATGEAAMNCSSVAYYFARALQDELEVPVGLVVTSWGGTPAQAWTSPEVVSRFPDHGRALEALRSADNSGQAARDEAFWASVDALEFFATRFKEAAFDDGNWAQQEQPAHFETGPIGDHDGVVWYRREVDVPATWVGSDLELRLPAIDDADRTFWNGEPIGTTLVPGGYAQPRRYRVPASEVRPGIATIAVQVIDTGGPGGFTAPQPMTLVRGEEFIDISGPWRVRKSVDARSIPALPFPITPGGSTPAALFNGMLAPLVPVTIQGVIWYQGESNRSRAEEYRSLFPAMIIDWRTQWQQPSLPFYFAQIAPYDYRQNDRDNSLIAQLREAQALTTRLPNTGMVLTADIGDPRDIHPVNKWDVGSRFARFALRDVYGRTDVEPNGPTAVDVTRDGAALRVTFEHVGEGLRVRGDSLDHFEVAGADGSFQPATAVIGSDGATVEVRCDAVTTPTAVRYLWSDAGEATLMGGFGLPAAPFRRTL